MLRVILDLTLDTLQYHNKSIPLTIAIILVTEVGSVFMLLIINVFQSAGVERILEEEHGSDDIEG